MRWNWPSTPPGASEPAAWLWSGWAAACLVAFVAAICAARAQPLTLETIRPPEAGEGLAAERLAVRLDREAGETGGAPGAWRRLAARCLRVGEDRGEAGSALVLLGGTLALRREAFDDLIDSGTVDPVAARLAGSSLERLGERVASGAAGGVRGVERGLREALAPIVDAGPWPAADAGWFLGPPLAVARAAGAGDRGIAGGVVEPGAITALRDALRRAETVPSLRRGARLTRSRLMRATTLATDPPAWLSEEAARAFAGALSEASSGVTDPDRRPDSQRMLAWLGRLAGAADGLDGLEPDRRRRDLRRVRGAFDRFVRERADRPAMDRVELLCRGIELLDLSAYDAADAGLVRHLRPALLALRREARRSSWRLLAQMEVLFETEAPASDPAAISLLLDQEASRRAMDELLTLHDVLADPERSTSRGPLIRPRYRRVGERLLDLAPSLERDSADALGARAAFALDEIRELAGVLGRLNPMPGERLLRPAGEGSGSTRGELVRELIGAAAGPLAEAMDRARASWVEAWTEHDRPRRRERLRAEIDLLERLGAAIEAAAWAEPDGSAQAWPGWTLSERAFNTLMTPFRRDLRRAVLAVVRGEEDAGERVDGLIERHAGAMLAGVLERELVSARGAVPEWLRDGVQAEERGRERVGWGDDASRLYGVVHEVGLGPPDRVRAWGVDARARLASVCRYAEELAKPGPASDEGVDRERLRSLIAARARTAIGQVAGGAGRR